MKKYGIRLGNRDIVNEDLKPIKRNSFVRAIIGTIVTCIGINQLMKSAKLDGSEKTIKDVQAAIDEFRSEKLTEEEQEEQ